MSVIAYRDMVKRRIYHPECTPDNIRKLSNVVLDSNKEIEYYRCHGCDRSFK